MRIVILTLCCLFVASCGKPTPRLQEAHKSSPPSPEAPEPLLEPEKPEEEKEWQKVASFGAITTVYMSPAAFSDKHYIAQVLHTLRSQKSVQEIWFYDNKTKTPTGVPMTDDQMLHWRAKYSVNRSTGQEEFVFINVTNPDASPPGISAEKANIRPGYAE